jgi:hypothetical protein
VVVEFEDLFWAKGDTDPAALAEIPVYFNHRSLFFF